MTPRTPEQAVRLLRELESLLPAWCREAGDNDWPADAHPADVIDHHLVRPASARIRILEAENERLTTALRDCIDSWGKSWDCSRDPGHGIMTEAIIRAQEALT